MDDCNAGIPLIPKLQSQAHKDSLPDRMLSVGSGTSPGIPPGKDRQFCLWACIPRDRGGY